MSATQPDFTPGPYSVEQRSEFCFAVLGRNPDAGKDDVPYSGERLTICTTDGRDEALRLVYCLTLVDLLQLTGTLRLRQAA